jgi:hypothetical protein
VAKFYSKLSENGKNVFILVAIALLGLVVLAPFFFFQNVGLGFGWILGSGIEILCYLSILWGAKIITDAQTKHPGTIALAALFSILRLALYAGGLVLGAYYTYKLKTNWLNVWTVFVAYLPLGFVLAITALINNNKAKKACACSKEESKPETAKTEETKPAEPIKPTDSKDKQ